jgi:hypothetical protein
MGPFALLLGRQADSTLFPAVDPALVDVAAPREAQAALTFRANVDSLRSGMTPPNTATPQPTVVAAAFSLAAVGCALLRTRRA